LFHQSDTNFYTTLRVFVGIRGYGVPRAQRAELAGGETIGREQLEPTTAVDSFQCPWINRAKEEAMLRWAVAFFLIAIVAAIFGFGGIAVAAAGIAKILFFLFVVLFLLALIGGLVRRA
jgi:uncharacterized membrane protein YtjA (UPF0391 family)